MRPVSRLTSAVVMVMPADGPSLGIAPAGTCRWNRRCVGSRVDAELVGVRLHVRQRDLRRLLHHVAELAGEGEAGSPSIVVASMKSTSPPAPVTARPVATPGTPVRSAASA